MEESHELISTCTLYPTTPGDPPSPQLHLLHVSDQQVSQKKKAKKPLSMEQVHPKCYNSVDVIHHSTCLGLHLVVSLSSAIPSLLKLLVKPLSWWASTLLPCSQVKAAQGRCMTDWVDSGDCSSAGMACTGHTPWRSTPWVSTWQGAALLSPLTHTPGPQPVRCIFCPALWSCGEPQSGRESFHQQKLVFCTAVSSKIPSSHVSHLWIEEISRHWYPAFLPADFYRLVRYQNQEPVNFLELPYWSIVEVSIPWSSHTCHRNIANSTWPYYTTTQSMREPWTEVRQASNQAHAPYIL